MADRHTPLQPSKSLYQAAAAAPVLAQLRNLMAQSSSQLSMVAPLLPVGIRAHVKAGPLDETTWCLLVMNGSVAIKLRHLVPDMEHHLLQSTGRSLQIRIKISKPG